MKRLLILTAPIFLLFSAFGPSTEVRQFKYEVLLDGRPIGIYNVNRMESNGTVNFKVETNTAAGLIRRSEHRSLMLSSYKDSKLISSQYKTWVNEKLETTCALHWDGNQYVRQEGDELTEICNQMVSYSSACIYFEEPKGQSKLFYEQYGQELELRPIGEHQYEVNLPNGALERFTYENGKAVRVDMVKSFTTISLKLAS
jgi:hypothetical protein